MLNQLQPWQNDKEEQKHAFCTKCKCEWFEQLSVNRYLSNHSSILGQTIPPAESQNFVMLRCIKCAEIYQPNIIITAQDRATKLHNVLLDQLEDVDVKETPETKV